jgi:hypothetical protein
MSTLILTTAMQKTKAEAYNRELVMLKSSLQDVVQAQIQARRS